MNNKLSGSNVDVVRKSFFLYPGNLFVATIPHMVTTILGSCVAVCIWDKVRKTGGINHYLLPLWNGRSLHSPKYGNIATEKLIEKMLQTGSAKEDLRAKIFGGATILTSGKNSMKIGEQNIMIAEQLLEEHHIPVISSHVGGHQGRKIIYHTDSGTVLLKKIIKRSTETED